MTIYSFAGTDNKCIEGVMFAGWGSHTDHTGAAYLTAAAAIGMTMLDLERFIKRLEKVEIKSFLISNVINVEGVGEVMWPKD